MGPRQGAEMAALQDDTLNRQSQTPTDISAIVQQAGGGGGSQTVNSTVVNQNNVPDRDLTVSMYTPQMVM